MAIRENQLQLINELQLNELQFNFNLQLKHNKFGRIAII